MFITTKVPLSNSLNHSCFSGVKGLYNIELEIEMG